LKYVYVENWCKFSPEYKSQSHRSTAETLMIVSGVMSTGALGFIFRTRFGNGEKYVTSNIAVKFLGTWVL